MIIISIILTIAIFTIVARLAFKIGYNRGKEDGVYDFDMKMHAALRAVLKEFEKDKSKIGSIV